MDLAAACIAIAVVVLILWWQRARQKPLELTSVFAGRPAVRMTYADRDGVITSRNVFILSLEIENARVTRFQAWCTTRNAQREFRIDRVLDMTDMQTGEHVAQPASYLLRYSGDAVRD